MNKHLESIIQIFGSIHKAKTTILQAAHFIDAHGIPAQRKSKTYFVKINEKKYPTVYLLDVAIYLNSKQKEITKFNQNSIQANRFFENLGFKTLYVSHLGDVQDEEYVSEKDGSPFLKSHKRKERDSKLVRLVKSQRLEKTGELCCDVCGFDFFKVYGLIGKGFIEAHHLVPVSQLKKGDKVKVSDFALVCSNCHRMLHNKKDKLLTIKQLKANMK